VTLSIDGQAKIRVTVGSPDTGTGAHSVVGQIVADHLQVPVEDVDVLQGDTLSTSFESGASGSRLTTTVGQAVDAAATEAKSALRRLAAERLNCALTDVEEVDDGMYAARGQTIGLKALMGWAETHGRVPLTCSGENTPQDFPDLTQFAAQFAEVEVDRDTGQVRVRHVVTAHDVGTLINPVTHQGQIEGGLVQAWGQAMCEHLVLENGLVVTAHHGEYKLPTIMDIPPLTTVLVPAPGRGPFSIKAIAEMSNVALPAAIANAIYDAVGVRAFELPIRAENIYWQLHSQHQESRG
jgi:CO/xanthine dehydrogenase Mo-binding subunit